jgi:hypothetical protein
MQQLIQIQGQNQNLFNQETEKISNNFKEITIKSPRKNSE